METILQAKQASVPDSVGHGILPDLLAESDGVHTVDMFKLIGEK